MRRINAKVFVEKLYIGSRNTPQPFTLKTMHKHLRTSLIAFLLAMGLSLGGTPAFGAGSTTLFNPNSGGSFPSIKSGLSDIPPCDQASVRLQPIWRSAAVRFRLRWQILAAITKIESEFGCNMGPSSAGATGWTQFLPSTWERWGMDGDGDGLAQPNNAVDAVFSTARYLRATGAPKDYRKAIYAYNHADWYVREVFAIAETFGDFSQDEFAQLTELTQKGQQLELQIRQFGQRLAQAKQQQRTVTRRLDRSRRSFKNGQRAWRLFQERFTESRNRLNRTTLEYIELTQGISAGGQGSGSENTAVLEYMADTNPQDAVLVYQSAGSLINQQTTALSKLRALATEADQAKEAAERVLLNQQARLQQQQKDVSYQRETIRLHTQGLAKLARAKKRHLKTSERYARLYKLRAAEDGSLTTSPFGGSLADLTAAQRMVALARAELAWGVRESPDGSNDSPDIARYRTATQVAPVGAWCAYFISYLALHSGSPIGPGGSGTGRVAEIITWGKNTGRWSGDIKQARAGDIILFYEHLGLVEKVSSDGSITTIEGNSSNQVRRRIDREKAAIGIVRL